VGDKLQCFTAFRVTIGHQPCPNCPRTALIPVMQRDKLVFYDILGMGTVKIEHHFISGIVLFAGYKIPVGTVPLCKAGLAIVPLAEYSYSMLAKLLDFQKHSFIVIR